MDKIKNKARKKSRNGRFQVRLIRTTHITEPPSITEADEVQMRPLDVVTPDSGVPDNHDADTAETVIVDSELDENHIDSTKNQSMELRSQNSSPVMTNNNLNRFLMIPQSGPHSFTQLSPKPMRRAISDRALNELGVSPRLRRHGIDNASNFFGDSISVIGVSTTVEMSSYQKKILVKRHLSQLLSVIYAVFLLILGAVLYVSGFHGHARTNAEVFSTIMSALGIMWLILLHLDLYRYKREVLRQLKEREDAMQEAADTYSNATEFIFNTGYEYASKHSPGLGHGHEDHGPDSPPYRFLQGRHSGSFYLKIGMAAFCFGNLIYNGLQLGQHILNFVDEGKKQWNCSRPSSVVVQTIMPIHSFYQLFMTFKYSNIIINRYKVLARFGLMHLIATCLCFWLNTIIEEAVEDYDQKNNMTGNHSDAEFDFASYHVIVQKREHMIDPHHCESDSILSARSMEAVPYLYPFAIEYNLLLAGVWYIMWQNIGQDSGHSDHRHFRHTISQDEDGYGDIEYQSNLVISADCHASNKGLFMGLFVLLGTIVTVIVFFVAMNTDGYQERAVSIHTGQEGILTLLCLIGVVVSFFQMRKLDINTNPITFLDDVLMFVPLPFFFLHGMMSIIAEYHNKSFTRLGVHVLVTIQVIIQTSFIIDGLRRCSNTQSLRYKKPGREIVTLMIILNVALWIVNTFELRSVEQFHAQEEFFGGLVWMFIGHSTLPLMLFYRFHSSVCLSDMWKSAYEKES